MIPVPKTTNTYHHMNCSMCCPTDSSVHMAVELPCFDFWAKEKLYCHDYSVAVTFLVVSATCAPAERVFS